MRKVQTFGALTPEISERETAHRKLARLAAAGGIVLLKNDGVLPMRPQKIAVYGPGSRKTVKGGSGSGEVHERHSVTIEEGLKNAGFTFPTTLWMDRFIGKYEADVSAWKQEVNEAIKGFGPAKTMQMFIKIGEHPMPYPSCTPVREDELTDETDTAIYVLSRQAGEGKDRHVEEGDYLLSSVEKESLKLLSAHYRKLILVLNCGSVVDLSILDEARIDAVLFYGQGGMEGGNALADILTGAVCPSGRLTDTWGLRYEDYPSAKTFSYLNGDLENEDYSEGIFVGYRWFDEKGLRPRYAFGHGLSYTTFRKTILSASEKEVRILVENTGSFEGKETVLLYAVKPEGKIAHEKKSLIAFAKTRTLKPGEKEELLLSFDLKHLSAFDEIRKAYVLEEGEYRLLINGPAEDADNGCEGLLSCGNFVSCGSFTLSEEHVFPVLRIPKEEKYSEHVEKMLGTLSDRDRIRLVTGGGYAIRAYNNVMGAAGRTCTKLLRKGIPNIVLSDGPAGLNVVPEIGVRKDGFPAYPNGLPDNWRWGWLTKMEGVLKRFSKNSTTVYRYMTAWPSETVLAQSFDMDLLEKVGAAIGREMLEIGISVWLAPGMNIHRNPLCGRNFEYYSEDPLVSGKAAAAVTRGVQSQGGVGVSIKHFCCNNQEDNRTGVSENVSERALREIYLRAFEIAVREGKPWTVMSSYNRVNGRYVCNSKDLLTGVLREEWGFEGLVMSDWNATDPASHVEAVNAGNDLIMPGNKGVEKALGEGLKNGTLDKKALKRSAGRVLEMIFRSAACADF